ncbi:cystathionine beta-lyase [Acidomonas methanolica]|uniref:Cystathionine beta-lyase n=1 Tax=Acidomonas methanolica NBRC 104435 TaxID=1231351 RepID=A0A023D5H5_ACIMT|nr:cystathionine beta-lyase [Acidomonas methanolica]MBU2653272.1 cystathionine beta-lyase [Acidomonas methanolica]GAJ29025.1 cystathionine beta-lyase [Acidomonas methanolica NBRC 104435]GBQ52386.1 cystathionine beta-lyase [Acidomonas methanolica]GEK97655.1 cystathionine beta-lyase [Acidomonas methanolica NBRC 104435]
MPVNQDEERVSAGWAKLGSLLVQGGRPEESPEEGVFVNAPVTRGSTVLYPDVAALRNNGSRSYDHELVYGAMGSPVQHMLERLLARIEGGGDCQVVSSGLAACTTPLLAFMAAGEHLLLPDSVYFPTRRFADTMLARMGISTTYYPPMAGEADITALMRPETSVLFAESPGSHTFEVQDVPMLARIAHAHGTRLMLDNTWGIGVFQPFLHGVDVSIQALTKYPAGHSDAILGAVTVANGADWKILRDAAIQLGQLAGPDECWLTLRGLRTMGVRLERQSRSALALAHWLRERPEVARVLHPALEDCPGHQFWRRDFTGASALFGVELRAEYPVSAMEDMIDALALFGRGASWGGYESLVLPTTGGIRRVHADGYPRGPTFRLHIGLENVADLKADLAGGFEVLRVSTEG